MFGIYLWIGLRNSVRDVVIIRIKDVVKGMVTIDYKHDIKT